MCGIAGIHGEIDGIDTQEVASKMLEKLTHRGPDAQGVFVSEEIVLAHRRLSIIDLSVSSNQPFTNSSGRFSLVFNGELYNYKELKSQLNYNFTTNSDTEVVLAAYEEWGPDCCRRFNGMFAFAIWDKVEKSLFIARDRMGIKPLYFYNSNNLLVFASEIRALLESGLVPKKVNKNALIDYVRYQTVHAPETIIEGVEMLPAGHYIKICADELETGKYWSILDNYSQRSQTQSRAEIKHHIRSLLKKSVERRLVSDVPFGAFLSGGIDSSVIVGLMSEVAENNVKTFCVTFEEEEFSEAKYARMIADKFGTTHQEIKLTPNDFLKDLPFALSAMDHPSGDGPNTYVVSKATKEAGVSMALSGLGGDELFAGYDIFKRSLDLESKKFLNSFPKILRQLGGGLLKTIRPSVATDKINEILKGDRIHFEYTYPVSRQVSMDNELIKMFNREQLPKNAVFSHLNNNVGVGSSGISLPVLSKVSFAEMTTYMQNVLLRDTDQMSMAHSLEVRVPFLDHELVEYVFGISDAIKYPNYAKQLLVESVGDLLPPEIVHRPKMGFTLPWEQWMKGDLKSFCEERIEKFAKRQEVNEDYIMRNWDSFLSGHKSIKWSKLWYLIVLENWLTENEIE